MSTTSEVPASTGGIRGFFGGLVTDVADIYKQGLSRKIDLQLERGQIENQRVQAQPVPIQSQDAFASIPGGATTLLIGGAVLIVLLVSR